MNSLESTKLKKFVKKSLWNICERPKLIYLLARQSQLSDWDDGPTQFWDRVEGSLWHFYDNETYFTVEWLVEFSIWNGVMGSQPIRTTHWFSLGFCRVFFGNLRGFLRILWVFTGFLWVFTLFCGVTRDFARCKMLSLANLVKRSICLHLSKLCFSPIVNELKTSAFDLKRAIDM